MLRSRLATLLALALVSPIAAVPGPATAAPGVDATDRPEPA
jgi:hypothetical protein